jgi:hypothetical protein
LSFSDTYFTSLKSSFDLVISTSRLL